MYLVTTYCDLFYLFIWTWDSISFFGVDRDPWLLPGQLFIFFIRCFRIHSFINNNVICIFNLFIFNLWLNQMLFWHIYCWFLFKMSCNTGWWWFCGFVFHWWNWGLISSCNLILSMNFVTDTGPFGHIYASNIDIILNLLDIWYIQIHILSNH